MNAKRQGCSIEALSMSGAGAANKFESHAALRETEPTQLSTGIGSDAGDEPLIHKLAI